ncbi:MAG: DNA-processing protein DprA [Chloroflexota bacterium]|nr:DNA-processing protein DprA [Dehalococcoidia bacterium]MDW8254728.1 DNA-processing protein DprA [Chloroflexota bacterium]
MSEDLAYRIALARVPGIGPSKFRRLEQAFGDLSFAWRASAAALAAAGIDERTREALAAAKASIDPERELEQLHRAGVRAFDWNDPAYPRLLREIDAAPPVLFVRGTLRDEDSRAIAVVGTRRATPYGRQAAAQFARDLAQRGYTVVSGLARGIDTVAHLASLDAGGRTIAVFGSGLDIIYPAENAKLAARIVEQGALVSEYPLGTKPAPTNFPQRNRIISGLSRGVLVVEGDRSSGALLTLAYALNQNRETFAVPGSIFSSLSDGPNQFIKRGLAKLVSTVEDVIDEVGPLQGRLDMQEALTDDPVEAALLPHLSREPLHIDELCRLADLPAASVSAALVMLELKGVVRHLGGMQYARAV